MNFSCYNKTSEELRSLNPKFAVLPIGAFEQHGQHLPMNTDTLIASTLGNSLCEALNGMLLQQFQIQNLDRSGRYARG